VDRINGVGRETRWHVINTAVEPRQLVDYELQVRNLRSTSLIG
jgi:hypothetical protein